MKGRRGFLLPCCGQSREAIMHDHAIRIKRLGSRDAGAGIPSPVKRGNKWAAGSGSQSRKPPTTGPLSIILIVWGSLNREVCAGSSQPEVHRSKEARVCWDAEEC